MTYQEILYAVDQGIATVTLNRPDRLNAWTTTMEHEVRQAMAAAAGDDAVKVVVLTGAGRGFCAGADMALLQGVEDSSPEDRYAAAKKLIDETPIPGRLDVHRALRGSRARDPKTHTLAARLGSAPRCAAPLGQPRHGGPCTH